MSKGDDLAFALNEFLAVSPDVEAAAIVSVDGLPMTSALPDSVEEDRLAAMSAALLTLGERAAAGLGKGQLSEVFVEAERGHVVLMSAGGYAVLVALTTPAAKMGLVLFEMRRIARRIVEVLEAPEPYERPHPSSAEPRGNEEDRTPRWEEPVQPTPEWQPNPASETEAARPWQPPRPEGEAHWAGEQGNWQGRGDEGARWEAGREHSSWS